MGFPHVRKKHSFLMHATAHVRTRTVGSYTSTLVLSKIFAE